MRPLALPRDVCYARGRGKGVRNRRGALEDLGAFLVREWKVCRRQHVERAVETEIVLRIHRDAANRQIVVGHRAGAGGRDAGGVANRVDQVDGLLRLQHFGGNDRNGQRSEEHTSELQSLMRISYAVFCLKKKKKYKPQAQMTISHTTY